MFRLKITVFLSAFAFLLPTAFSQTGGKVLEGVSLNTSGVQKEGQTLQFVGAGLRAKKVIMVNVRAYVAEFFVKDLSKFKKNEPLKSLPESSPALIQLHFLRDVEGEKVQTSFREALEANKVDLKKPEIQKLLDAVKNSGEAKKGSTMGFYGAKKGDGSEVIIFEDSNSKATTISGGAGFIQDTFAIWLGNPSDSGIAQLKADILK